MTDSNQIMTPSASYPSANPSANPRAVRAMERILTQAAIARGYAVLPIGGGPEAPANAGWILRFTRTNPDASLTIRHAHGFCLDLNPAATHMLAHDKSGTADALHAANLPAVPHRVYLHPRLGPYVPRSGNWPEMLAFAESHNFDIVAKDNTGTGGYGVRRVRCARDLERAAYDLFQRTHAIALSPYLEITNEVRFIILNNTIELAYAKERLSVLGDGVSTVLELLATSLGVTGRDRVARLLSEADHETLPTLATVPAKGASALLNWKHNLGQGAIARTIVDPLRETPALAQLAVNSARAINLVFGSVDVVVTDSGPKVLEINAGVMMEALANDSAEGNAIATRIYSKALDCMFAPQI